MNRNIVLRTAREEDAEGLLSIYAPYVENTAVSFEYETPSLQEFKERIREISADYPYLVCEVDGTIAGYAYAHRLFARKAYQWDVELSIYLSPQFQRQGIGARLYAALIALLQMQHIRNLYALVTSPNTGSERLHAQFGFTLAGVYHKAGYKCGNWHDVLLFERLLVEEPQTPAPFLPFPMLDSDKIREVLRDESLRQTDREEKEKCLCFRKNPG